MEVEGEQRETMTSDKVMCLLTDPEGTHLGAPMYLPQDTGPQQLQQMVNKLLNNVSFIDFGPFFWLLLLRCLCCAPFGCWESAGKENWTDERSGTSFFVKLSSLGLLLSSKCSVWLLRHCSRDKKNSTFEFLLWIS